MTDASSGIVESNLAVPNVGEFRDPTRITNVLRILLSILIVANAVSIISNYFEISLLQDLQSGSHAITKDDTDASDIRQRMIALASVAINITTVIVFCFWIFRANKNARQLGAVDMQFAPGWAVGWYFVPIANLWKPYDAMKEIWKASADPANWQSVARPEILPFWWLFFLLDGFAGRAAARFDMIAHDANSYATADGVSMLADVADVICAWLAISLISEITRMQLSHVRS